MEMKADSVSPTVALDQGEDRPHLDPMPSTLESKIDYFIDDLVSQEANSPIFDRRIEAIIAIGQKEIREASSQSNRFLMRPMRAIDQGSSVSENLASLRQTIEQLDPSHNDFFKGRRLLGFFPFKRRINTQQYFDSYQTAQSHIGSVLIALTAGKSDLLQDNAAIKEERINLWYAMNRLEQMAALTKMLDARLEARIGILERSDPKKARALKESALFYTRQRSMDLLTQLAVIRQGYMALEQVKRNNVELIKGVDRASTTTVSALQTAVTVAQALASQKLVLDQIQALNSTTTAVVDSTGDLMRDNTTQINRDASNAAISLLTLKKAFQNVYDTMDSIDRFKTEALETMRETVTALSQEIETAKTVIGHHDSPKVLIESSENKVDSNHVGGGFLEF